MAAVDQALHARQATLTARERRIGDQLLVRQIKRVGDGVMPPQAVIDNTLKNPKAIAVTPKFHSSEARA